MDCPFVYLISLSVEYLLILFLVPRKLKIFGKEVKITHLRDLKAIVYAVSVYLNHIWLIQ